MGLTATAIAIAVILLAPNFTIINAQQQQQLSSQPGEIENGTTPAATIFQSTNDSFSVQVPQGWVINDVNNTGSAFLQERTQGYGILAQLCPEEQQQGAVVPFNASGGGSSTTNSISIVNDTSSCQGSQDIIHIIRYLDLETRIQPANNVTTYHLQKLQEVGYRDIETLNSMNTTVNLTNPQTNETITTELGRFVEMTYSTNFAPNETRIGYFILTATNATAPDLGTTKGYSVFYEGNSTSTDTAAEITTAAVNLPPPPAVSQVFDSFELIAAPEVAQALAEEAQAIETVESEDEDNGNGGDTSCDPSYPDVCIPPPPPDLDCGDEGVPENFEVSGSDPHGFDGDNDDIGCETDSEPEDEDNGDEDNGADDDDDNGNNDNGNGDLDAAGPALSGIFEGGISTRGRPADDYDADPEAE